MAKPELAILHTNRQLYAETSDFLWKNTTKCFQQTSDFSQFLHHRLQDPSDFNTLRSLELSFSHREYIYLFKVPLPPFTQPSTGWNNEVIHLWGCDGLADKLPTLTHVQKFSLRFTSPFDALIEDPWGYTGDKNGHEWYTDRNDNRDVHGFQATCLRTIVDWILTFAKNYIKHFPEIELGGAIKDSTKLKFDAIFADEKKETEHDMTAAKQAVENWPSWNL